VPDDTLFQHLDALLSKFVLLHLSVSVWVHNCWLCIWLQVYYVVTLSCRGKATRFLQNRVKWVQQLMQNSILLLSDGVYARCGWNVTPVRS
jgi:hypothetical protein